MQRWGEGPPVPDGQGIRIGVEGVEADVIGAGVQVGVHPLGDRCRAPPGDHGVDQPIAATGGEVLGAESTPLPGAQ